MRWLPLWALLGCGPTLDGRWTGECTVDTAKGPQTYELDYTVIDVGSDQLEGDALVLPPFFGDPVAGTLTGTVQGNDGPQLSLLVELGEPELGFTIRHDVRYERDGEGPQLTGPCTVQVQSVSPSSGDGTLNRQSDVE